jgi:hypothetical protein
VNILAIIVLGLWGQPPFSSGKFEFGEFRRHEGMVVEWPYPMLVTKTGPFLLVGEGKFGVAAEVRGHDGDSALLEGALIERGAQRMLEVKTGSLRMTKGTAPAEMQTVDLGLVTLTGEIVDMKCHLGVMKPGEGKVHRGCAARCISGGIPAGFLVRDPRGETSLMLLTGSDGRALGRELLDYVAEPVRVTGHMIRRGSTLVLKAEPKDFRRE